MRLVFAGTPEFAATALSALIDAGHRIALVLSQPDRPSGRGMTVRPGAVKSVALAHGIDVIQPQGLRIGGRFDEDARAAHDRLRATPHDAMIVAAYGLILPPDVLSIAPFGCINIHASLLPRWRGAAPIQRAIEAGDRETGITIMQMDAGLDTGKMWLKRSIAIDPADTGGTLTAKLAVLGGAAIVDALPSIEAGTLSPVAQGAEEAVTPPTYAAKLTKSEAALDFAAPTRTLVDRIRAFDPWPGCSAVLRRDGAEPLALKIWQGEAAVSESGGESHPAGCVFGRDARGRIVVATGDGAIALGELQRAGGKRLAARSFTQEFDLSASPRLTAG